MEALRNSDDRSCVFGTESAQFSLQGGQPCDEEDSFGETMKLVERAKEDIYFAEHDRELIEKLSAIAEGRQAGVATSLPQMSWDSSRDLYLPGVCLGPMPELRRDLDE